MFKEGKSLCDTLLTRPLFRVSCILNLYMAGYLDTIDFFIQNQFCQKIKRLGHFLKTLKVPEKITAGRQKQPMGPQLARGTPVWRACYMVFLLIEFFVLKCSSKKFEM